MTARRIRAGCVSVLLLVPRTVCFPCAQNGARCVDGVNAFTCQCGTMFAGVHCEESEHCVKALSLDNVLLIRSFLLSRFGRSQRLRWRPLRGTIAPHPLHLA
jgi:hypothetical protein